MTSEERKRKNTENDEGRVRVSFTLMSGNRAVQGNVTRSLSVHGTVLELFQEYKKMVARDGEQP